MADLLKGIIGSISRLLLNWVWPLLLAALTFFYLLALPSFSDVAKNLFTDTGATFAVLLAFGSLTGGFIMSALSTSLYRVLEGYYWPHQIRDWGKKKQKRRIETLRTRANVAEGVEQALIFEQLSRFPADTLQLAPTAFGNAMRAFETFGVDRYCLDSQGFWAELTNVVPTGLRDEVGRSRAAVDFFVSLTFVSGAFAVANFVAFFSIDSAPRFLIAAVVGLLAIPACYRGALSSTAYWRNTVYAVVNLGRKPLAEGLGLDLPPTLEQERTMWERVAGFSFYPFDPAWVDTLDEFRTGKPAPAPFPEPSDSGNGAY
jgi:hypothetical protein